MKVEISKEELKDLEAAITGAISLTAFMQTLSMIVPKKDFPMDKNEIRRELVFLAKAGSFVDRVKGEIENE